MMQRCRARSWSSRARKRNGSGASWVAVATVRARQRRLASMCLQEPSCLPAGWASATSPRAALWRIQPCFPPCTPARRFPRIALRCVADVYTFIHQPGHFPPVLPNLGLDQVCPVQRHHHSKCNSVNAFWPFCGHS